MSGRAWPETALDAVPLASRNCLPQLSWQGKQICVYGRAANYIGHCLQSRSWRPVAPKGVDYAQQTFSYNCTNFY